MKLVHLETIVQTTFGILDSEGDIIEKKPLNVNILKMNKESLDALLKFVLESKEKLQQELDASGVKQEVING